MNTLRVPAEDFYQLIFELPKSRFLHTPSFVGMALAMKLHKACYSRRI